MKIYKAYIPTTDADVLARIQKAAATNAQRDKTDRESGAGAPGDNGLAGLMRTAICAIISGIRGRSAADQDCVYEGLAMIIKAEAGVRYLEDVIEERAKRAKEFKFAKRHDSEN